MKPIDLFNFVRRELLYFLILILSVLVIFISREPKAMEAPFSPAVIQLQQSVQDWQKSLESVSGWMQIMERHPKALLICAAILLIFFALFSGGLVMLVLVTFIPNLRTWFYKGRAQLVHLVWPGVILFRVLILVFSIVVTSGVVIGSFWGAGAQDDNMIALLQTLVIDVLACLCVVGVLKKEATQKFRFLGLNTVNWVQEVKRALAAYTMVFPVFLGCLFFVLGISEWLHYEPPVHPLVKIFTEEAGRSALILNFALILAAVAAPIFEEIFFRGFCYRVLRGWWGARAAAIGSAAFFAGMHGSGFAFLPIFILGLALAWLYEARGNLTACWAFHILHNVLFTGYFFSIKALLAN